MSVERAEMKYAMLKLVHSGRTLGEAKALMKAVAVGLTGEYAKQRDIIDLLALEGTLHKITGTRAAKVEIFKLFATSSKVNYASICCTLCCGKDGVGSK